MKLVAGVARPLVLSPMVDVTDAAFRSIASEWGADVTCSEMVSAAGLVHGNKTSWSLVQPWPGESPYGVQLMGGDPAMMADAVGQVVERIDPDFIDLNLGCPSPNILRSCAGGFLLRDPKQAGRVISAAVEAAGTTPVSVKMRTGTNDNNLTFIEVGQEAEAAGAAWCTLHGRTVEQGYSGSANWGHIATLVDSLDIPVVGNGDLRTPDDLARMEAQTSCAGFFIARAAMHDPTIFARMRDVLVGIDPRPEPDLGARLQQFQLYIERSKTLGEPRVADLRRQGTRFFSGAPGAKKLRTAMHDAKTIPEIEAVTRSFVA